MQYRNLVEALENHPDYLKKEVTVYGIAYSSYGEAFFCDIAFDNLDEAFDYYKENQKDLSHMKVRAMTYNRYGGIDIGWENGSICYRKDIQYI